MTLNAIFSDPKLLSRIVRVDGILARSKVNCVGLQVRVMPWYGGSLSDFFLSKFVKAKVRGSSKERGRRGPETFWRMVMLIRKHRAVAHTLERAFEREDLAIRDSEPLPQRPLF